MLDGSFDRRWVKRLFATLLLTGQVFIRLIKGKIYRHQIVENLVAVGLGCLLNVSVLAFFCGMIFIMGGIKNVQRFGGVSAIGAAFAFTFCRELAPLLTGGIVSGQIASSFAAEIGEMQVTEQIDALLMLRTNPIDYLVIPRVIACAIMVPILTIFALVLGLIGAIFIGAVLGKISPLNLLDSIRMFLTAQDMLVIVFKAAIFGVIVAMVACGWGLTTRGGSKELGRSTTAAVVTSTVSVFVSDFFISLLLFAK